MIDKKGFTLAEVLITLGIIGIVAAMTLPALVTSYKQKEATARLKKFYSSILQAIKMSELEYGEITSWTRGGGTQRDEDGNTDFEANGKITKDFFMTYLAPYFKYTTVKQGKNAVVEGDKETPASNTKIYLADGSIIDIWNGNCFDINFDVNGEKKPNIKGKDIFVFLICFDNSNRNRMCGNEKTAFCSYDAGRVKTREVALERCKNEGNHNYCSRLLEMDNWEFKKDYPFKL